LQDKERKDKFLSFQDREKRLEGFTYYINYIKPDMATGEITAYKNLLRIKNEKRYLIKEKIYDDILQITKERKEVADEKFVT